MVPVGCAEEGGVAVRVHGAVRTGQPVPRPRRRRGDADDRWLSDNALTRYGAEVRGIAVGEHAAVGSHQPVAPAVGRGRHARHRGVEPGPAGRAVEGRTPEAEDAAIGSDEPVAAMVGGSHADDGGIEAAGRP